MTGFEQGLTAATLLVAGFTACAEFGSYAFVHPVLRRLPIEQHIAVEQGLVRTFGRFMPFAMTGSLLLVVAWVSVRPGPWLGEAAAVALWAFGLVTTILVNVRINAVTARWKSDGDSDTWRAMRARWELFQGVRSWAFLASFAVVVVLVAWW
ncbi:anthrone oxygenase family protein [Ruania alba]|uniref:DUF1772 domain-containing protein n=1 Tax=Ruania alba TaxID=648782 RepID=A0A1H5MY81_9MICO|nr:DUF1772 domain-containing protein [Ruania alba]SEE94329.1 protein of unknown function [Ruania alba]